MWFGFRLAATSVEEAGHAAAIGGQGKAEVCPCSRHRDAAAGRAGDHALLDEERLVHVLDGLGLLADADRHGAEPDRAAAELLADRVEDRPVDLVETELVDAEQLQAGLGRVPR